eukprot:GABW01002302.1.p1 GENE.GABW01002302.1~~GABW01002302.1.p1  ORF type:complete len:81 (-),score=29.16 GABW01002302.1:3-245(-)
MSIALNEHRPSSRVTPSRRTSLPKKRKFRTGDTYILYSYLDKNDSWKRSGKTFTCTFNKAQLYFEDGNEEKKNYKLTHST